MTALDASNAQGQAPSSLDYIAIDQALARGELRFDRALAQAYAAGLAEHPEAGAMAAVKTRSMLAIETLLMMRAFAIEAGGPVLEVGAYMGGGTLALASGVMAAGRGAVLSVDRGGAYPDHPHLPTSDITADWLSAIERQKTSQKIVLIEGSTRHPDTRAFINQQVGDDEIGMITIDADGFVFTHIEGCLDFIARDVLLVVDDYSDVDASVESQTKKTPITQRTMNRAVKAGAIEMMVHLPWATWFGRATPAFHDVMPDLIAQEVAELDAHLAAKFGRPLPSLGAPRLVTPR